MSDGDALAQAVAASATLSGTFTLRSGTVSSLYFDKYRFEAEPALLRRVADRMLGLVPSDAEVLAGLELGGVPIVTAMALASGLPAAFVRKRAKDYGTCRAVEGSDVEGRKVVLIEDVITTGGAVVEAVREVRSAGGHVVMVVCAIWRGEGERAVLGIPVAAAFTSVDLAVGP